MMKEKLHGNWSQRCERSIQNYLVAPKSVQDFIFVILLLNFNFGDEIVNLVMDDVVLAISV